MAQDVLKPTFMSVQRQKHLKFTDEVAERYLQRLADGGGKMASAQEVGVSYDTIYRWERDEPEFARMVKDALVQFTEEKLERPAIQRATEGVEEPIIGGKFKDEIITTVRRPSDNLLIHLMKVYHPERHNPAKDVNLKGTLLTGNVDLSGASTDKLRKIYSAVRGALEEED